MSKQERHTIVRISLRSILGLTFGVALVMAVTGPYIKELDSENQKRLLFTLVSMTIGMAIGTWFIIRKRQRIGQESGPLLLSLAMKPERNKKWMRWFWLLFLMPFVVIHFSGATRSHNPPLNLLGTISLLLSGACYSMFLTQMGLELWAEGYTSAIEFCQNGIVHTQKFYAWSSSSLRDIYWSQSGEKLVINLNRAPITIPVPPHQREAVEAILEHYYRPAKAQN